MTVYLTSDPHFGHQLVSDLRGFAETADHDAEVLKTYHSLCKGDDLWILGDLSGGSRRAEVFALEILRIYRDVSGVRLHLVEGNHDSCASIHRDGWKRQRRFLEVFESVQAFARRRGPGRVPVLMSHYPYVGDGPERGPERYGYARLKDTGEWLLHGHTHQQEKLSGPRQIHVGWDAWRRPVAWHEIEQLIAEDTTEPDTCDECDRTDTLTRWSGLKTPVTLCEACEHDARRSGWIPGGPEVRG